MLTKLTDEQKNAIPEHVKKWIAIGLRTGETDKKTFEAAARKCYEHAELNPNVPIVWVKSPIVGAFAASTANLIFSKMKISRDAVDDAVAGAVRGAVRGAVTGAVRDAVDGAVADAVADAVAGAVHDAGAVRDAVDGAVTDAVSDAVYDAVRDSVGVKITWHYWMGGQLWAAWAAYVNYFIDVCGIDFNKNIYSRAMAYQDTVMSAAYWWPNSKFIIACERPAKILLNSNGQLHCENGQAIEWPDGWGLWMLNGVRVPPVILT
jgi:hypothetical protein